MMRSLPLALLAVALPLAAADRPASSGPTQIEIGIEHSQGFARPAGVAKGALSKPGGDAVEEDGTLIPVHLHVAADGSTRIECREEHAVRRVTPVASTEPQR